MDVRGIVFLLAPVVLASALLLRGARPPRAKRLLFYLGFLITVISVALHSVAWIAGARVDALEIVVVVWFAIGLRLAWELWRATLGRAGQRWVRWERRRRAQRGAVSLLRLIPLLRGGLTCVLLIPLFRALALTHRVKLSDGTNPMLLLGLEYEHVRVERAAGGALDAWFVPARGADRTIVICHGAGANKGNFIWFLPVLAHHGWNLVLFDFRAHGASSGRVCTFGITEKDDVRAIIDWLKRERAAEARVVVGLGSSLGAMALIRAAAEDSRVAAVVLDRFVSQREIALHHTRHVPLLGAGLTYATLSWMSLLAGADFLGTSAEAAVAAFGDRPLLVVHGADDVLMPAAHSQRLYDAARGPREIWFGPGPHSNILTTAPDEYSERLFDFLARTLGAGADQPRDR